jgi:hypothetical protein
VRVVEAKEGERLLSQEWKERFASNLDRLLGVVGLNRKEAAAEIGVSYKLLRRLVSAGVSRTDERNMESLKKIATYFALPSVEDFWRADLIPRLLASDEGAAFMEKFRPKVREEWLRRVHAARAFYDEEFTLMNRLFGGAGAAAPSLKGEYAERVAAILASPKANSFKTVIDAFYKLVARPKSHDATERA